MVKRRGAAAGTTLVELLVASTVVLVALATIMAVAVPWTSGVQALGEAADLQQRLRVAVTTLTLAIQRAGAAARVGPGAGLARPWPAVLPCRWARGEAPCQPTADSLTLLGIDQGLQLLVSDDMAGPSAPLVVARPPGCVGDEAACRFQDGARAVVADPSGARDEFVIPAVSADGALVMHAPATFSRAYAAGAVVGRSTLSSYYARADAVSGVWELRSSRGDGDFPLLEDVTALRFEYFGDPSPPFVLAASGEVVVVSYGPEPPPVGEDDPRDPWPAGENCTFAATEERHVARLPDLPAGADGLAALPLASFADGPWCPDAGSAWRFDADLLRVRRVRVTVRLQARSAAARGADLRFFSRPGSARDANAQVPDLEVSVDAWLRNAR